MKKSNAIRNLQDSIGESLIKLLEANYPFAKELGEDVGRGYMLAFGDIYLTLVGKKLEEDLKKEVVS